MSLLPDPEIRASRLVAGYEGKVVVGPVSFSVAHGEMIALLGANGSGKSTLLRILAGSQKPLSGTVEIEGRDIGRYAVRELARKIAIVYTDRVHAGGLTAEQVVSLGRHPHTSALGRLSEADRAIVNDAMEAVGITDMRNRNLSRMSDGERQKVMIARTLAQETPIVLLDEPTTFLDAASRLDMFRMLRQMALNMGKAVIVSTHDTGPAIAAATRLWLITSDGSFVDGLPDSLIADGSLSRLFPESKAVFSPTLRDFTLPRG